MTETCVPAIVDGRDELVTALKQPRDKSESYLVSTKSYNQHDILDIISVGPTTRVVVTDQLFENEY